MCDRVDLVFAIIYIKYSLLMWPCFCIWLYMTAKQEMCVSYYTHISLLTCSVLYIKEIIVVAAREKRKCNFILGFFEKRKRRSISIHLDIDIRSYHPVIFFFKWWLQLLLLWCSYKKIEQQLFCHQLIFSVILKWKYVWVAAYLRT